MIMALLSTKLRQQHADAPDRPVALSIIAQVVYARTFALPSGRVNSMLASKRARAAQAPPPQGPRVTPRPR